MKKKFKNYMESFLLDFTRFMYNKAKHKENNFFV